jgi:glycosyl transferase family 25
MKLKLLILLGISIICIILCILIQNKNIYLEAFKSTDDLKYYFVHIPKNGGMSIQELLKNENLNIEYIGHKYTKTNKNEIVVLRDPIDRFISAFYYLYKMKDEFNIPFKKIKTPDKFIEALNDKRNINHKEAIRIYQEDYLNQPIKGYIYGSNWVFAPQSLYYVNPSFVLRFTHLEDDFNKCLQDIGHKKRVSLPKKNTSIHKDTYLSDKSIAFLKEHYRKDFELLESNPFTYNTSEGFQNKNTNKLIDGVLYINLAHRTDRKKHIEKELNKLSPIYSNIERIDAVKHRNGGKGCGLSHIKALETAKKRNWKNVLIVEDDLIFKPQTNPVSYLNNTLNELNGNFDILMLSGNIYKISNTNKTNLSKPIKVQTTSCYLINNHYYDKLIDNFTESCNNLLDTKENTNYNKWAIDQNWSKLQEKDNWFIFNPTLAYQIEDYSDIEGKNVDYRA